VQHKEHNVQVLQWGQQKSVKKETSSTRGVLEHWKVIFDRRKKSRLDSVKQVTDVRSTKENQKIHNWRSAKIMPT
jgi:hypothetical protein